MFPAQHMLRRVSLKTLACALCLVFNVACSNDGVSKKDVSTETPRSSRQPSTSLPMPPAESAHSTSQRQEEGAWTLLDGRRGSLADYRGQVVVLDFYATYCPPCEEEIPHLMTIQRRFGPQGLKVIGLNVGGAEDQAKVPDFVKKLGIQYDLANPDDQTINLFLVGDTVIPQTLIFNRQGRLVKHLTEYNPRIAAQLDEAVQNALATKAD